MAQQPLWVSGGSYCLEVLCPHVLRDRIQRRAEFIEIPERRGKWSGSNYLYGKGIFDSSGKRGKVCGQRKCQDDNMERYQVKMAKVTRP